MKTKKFIAVSAFAMLICAMVVPMAASAATVNRTQGLGSLFTLDMLFRSSGSKILNSDKTGLGDLFILNQLFPVKVASAGATTVSLASKLSGRILLQVQENGEAWYVNPVTKTRVFLGGPAHAFQTMSDLGLGITNADFNSLSTNMPTNVIGRFIIKVEDAGQMYYVNPVDKSINFIGGPMDAANLIAKFGLGVTNSDLEQIKIAQ